MPSILFLANLLVAGLLAAPALPAVPPPPGGVFEAEITKAVKARAQTEMKAMLAELEKDTTRPEKEKAELKRKLGRLQLSVYTTATNLDDVVAYYQETSVGAMFLKGDRDLAADLKENARVGGLTIAPAQLKEWEGKTGRSARWTRDDGTLEIAVEDHLIDPRDGKVSKRTVVMITILPE
jgi:hypothetical protein